MANTEIQTFETTATHVADTLARLGVATDRLLTIVIEPDDWLTKARQESRRRVLAAGLSDEDLDRLIEQAREELQRAP
jgi:Ser/Thr protein kinase RdoA (MazF antagonist)